MLKINCKLQNLPWFETADVVASLHFAFVRLQFEVDGIDVILEGAGLRWWVLGAAVLAHQILRPVYTLYVRSEAFSTALEALISQADVRAQVTLDGLPWPVTPSGNPDELHGGPKGPLFLQGILKKENEDAIEMQRNLLKICSSMYHHHANHQRVSSSSSWWHSIWSCGGWISVSKATGGPQRHQPCIEPRLKGQSWMPLESKFGIKRDGFSKLITFKKKLHISLFVKLGTGHTTV